MSKWWGLFFIFLMGCIEAPKNATSPQNYSPSNPTVNRTNSETTLISGVPPSLAKQGINYRYDPDMSVPSGVTVTSQNLPSWASLNSSTGVITGSPTILGNTNNITLTAVKGIVYTQIGPFSLRVVGDPLYDSQWHLKNNGQSSFASNGGVSGVDLNLQKSIEENITGRGVVVAVSDSGLELTHPDLQNKLFDYHKDYNDGASNYLGDPTSSSARGDHGTSVAGIIAAEGWNGIGGRGIAPGALVSGLNYVSSTQAQVFQLDQATGPYSIFNYSYGYNFYPSSFPWVDTYQEQLLFGYTTGRGRLGSVYVKSAGNEYRVCDSDYGDTFPINGGICYQHSANIDPENNTIPMIVVGALNANGHKSSYSSVGSSLWISAFGGEFGSSNPAIVTTDQAGCNKGYSRSNVTTSNFMKGDDELNEDCDYTHTFNGTSSAAPMVSGVIALMLEANPSLTAREVKYILAVTADKITDPNFTGRPPHENSDFFSLSGHTYEQGWVTNNAGFSFHNHFGFGKVNADRAVAAAKVVSLGWGDLVHLNKDFDNPDYQNSTNRAIPDESAVGTSSTISIGESLYIESVQVKLNITHGRPGDLGIELTSPRGTKSILLNINNSFQVALDDNGSPEWVADLTDMVLSSNAFYGENSQGTWTLRVIDGLGTGTGYEFDQNNSQTGTLTQWDLNISGHY